MVMNTTKRSPGRPKIDENLHRNMNNIDGLLSNLDEWSDHFRTAQHPAVLTTLQAGKTIRSLSEENKKMKEAMEHIAEFWNRSENEEAMSKALHHMIDTAEHFYP
jgi:hypothetical protein